MSKRTIQAYTQQTVKKAMSWLEQQPSGLSQSIKDVNTAVELYLRNQKDTEAETSTKFTKELKKFCDQESLPDSEALPPAHSAPFSFAETESSFEESLDIKSQNLLKQTAEELNLSSPQEALRLLIQLGYKSLQNFLK